MITPAQLSAVIRDVRTQMYTHPKLTRETVLLLVVAGIVEAIKEVSPETDGQSFIEDCYSGG